MREEDWAHPADGLAGPCYRCKNYEWWSVVGPTRGTRCATSQAELDAWNVYDSEVARTGREPPRVLGESVT